MDGIVQTRQPFAVVATVPLNHESAPEQNQIVAILAATIPAPDRLHPFLPVQKKVWPGKREMVFMQCSY